MENNKKYKLVDYWNERYKEEESFEWFGEWFKFKSVINKKITYNDQILILGCGNSKMSEEMYRDNYKFITNIDYSSVIIELMEKKCAHLDKMKWKVMDINDLQFEQKFDCIIEKGTLDALLVEEKSPWNLSEENTIKMDNILKTISNLLKNNGVFISITFAQPHFRKPIYAQDKYNWNIEQFTIGETFHYFAYIMTKGKPLSEKDKINNFHKNTVSPIVYLHSDYLNENYLSHIETD